MVNPLRHPWTQFIYSEGLTSSNDLVSLRVRRLIIAKSPFQSNQYVYFSVGLGPDCVSTFEELKLKKNYSYIIYKLSPDKKSIIVDSTAKSTYETFIAALPATDCRYAVFDFEWEIDPSEGKR